MTINLDKTIGSNFCYAPWTNIHINPQGSYKVCCAGREELGDLRRTPISEILQSKKLIEIKSAILNNEYHTNCEVCTTHEQRSSSSERGWYNDIAQNQTVSINSIEEQHIQNLDIRWSNTCNLSCVYCGHDASSQWAALQGVAPERIDYSNTMPDILRFIDQNKGTLKNLGLLGGEPLLQKENEQLLDVIDENAHINLITNLSVPLENNKIFKKLLTKNRVVWDVSFETIENKFEYVRRGSTWDLITKNIRYLQDAIKDRPGHLVGITGQFSVYNALNLSEVNRYFFENNFPQPRWNELTYPEILSVARLPNHLIQRSITELEHSVQYITWPRQKKFLQDMANSLRAVNSDTKDCSQLLQWHHNQEQKYWPDFKYKFAELWPEYQC
jgi:MoaA/NifB/PqqE/SkfB family radical SAM enzyme